MKLETFQGKPKRKYVRKQVSSNITSENIVSYETTNNQNENFEEEENIINELDKIISENKKADNDCEDLTKSIKKMKIEEENKFIPIIRTKISRKEVVYYNPNVINVKDYEFLSNVKVYLYYISEKIGTNVMKYVFYSHLYKHIDHHIITSINEIPPYPKYNYYKIIEEEIILNNNVTLYVKEFCINKQKYTIEMCEDNLSNIVVNFNNKRKLNILENSFDYQFCQIYIVSEINNHKNSYVFEYDGKYISFEYNIYKNIKNEKLLTNF